jgi:hypothetical protein
MARGSSNTSSAAPSGAPRRRRGLGSRPRPRTHVVTVADAVAYSEAVCRADRVRSHPQSALRTYQRDVERLLGLNHSPDDIARGPLRFTDKIPQPSVTLAAALTMYCRRHSLPLPSAPSPADERMIREALHELLASELKITPGFRENVTMPTFQWWRQTIVSPS